VISDEQEAAGLFAAKLKESVRLHLRSDVPVGSALSGGLDSSAITVLAGRERDEEAGRLQTFSCTFPGDRVDERPFIDAVLSQQRAVAHFVTPDPEGFLQDVDRFVWIHDEPVGSLSNYAAYCLARRTRAEGICVALNGQGGDEILMGYWQSYFLFLRSLIIGGQLLGAALHFLGAMSGRGNPHLLLQVPTMLRRYRFQGREQFRFRFSVPEVDARVGEKALELDSQGQRLYQLRTLFLPRLLKWEDRNSMAFGVEGRYPFLDHELIELCLAFQPEVCFRRGWTKWPLRVGLADVLPDAVRTRRSKLGFEVPQRRWLCGELRPSLERWLAADRPLWTLVDRADVRRVADEMWSGKEPKEEIGQLLFRLFLFDRWMERFDAA
jgi:asparagine synthase (glutamine-hydrolysing)